MTRTPKRYDDNKWLVEFKVKNKQIFYLVSKWNESGTNLATISSGKYKGEDLKSLIPKLSESCAKP